MGGLSTIAIWGLPELCLILGGPLKALLAGMIDLQIRDFMPVLVRLVDVFGMGGKLKEMHAGL